MLIDAPKERIAAYVAERTGSRYFGGYTALAFERGGEIICGAVFDHWRVTDIEISAAGEEFPRTFLRAVGKYVFEGMKCRRITFRARSDNQKSLNSILRLGAKAEGIQREFFDGVDAVLFGVTKKEWRF